tara:strand:+ start:277 stop:2277 length:2001 start_codon:yes stop_codon:yes gene_type:complete
MTDKEARDQGFAAVTSRNWETGEVYGQPPPGDGSTPPPPPPGDGSEPPPPPPGSGLATPEDVQRHFSLSPQQYNRNAQAWNRKYERDTGSGVDWSGPPPPTGGGPGEPERDANGNLILEVRTTVEGGNKIVEKTDTNGTVVSRTVTPYTVNQMNDGEIDTSDAIDGTVDGAPGALSKIAPGGGDVDIAQVSIAIGNLRRTSSDAQIRAVLRDHGLTEDQINQGFLVASGANIEDVLPPDTTPPPAPDLQGMEDSGDLMADLEGLLRGRIDTTGLDDIGKRDLADFDEARRLGRRQTIEELNRLGLVDLGRGAGASADVLGAFDEGTARGRLDISAQAQERRDAIIDDLFKLDAQGTSKLESEARLKMLQDSIESRDQQALFNAVVDILGPQGLGVLDDVGGAVVEGVGMLFDRGGDDESAVDELVRLTGLGRDAARQILGTSNAAGVDAAGLARLMDATGMSESEAIAAINASAAAGGVTPTGAGAGAGAGGGASAAVGGSGAGLGTAATVAGWTGLAALSLWAGHTMLTSSSTVTYKGKQYSLDDPGEMKRYSDAFLADHPTSISLYTKPGNINHFQRYANEISTEDLTTLFSSLSRKLTAMDAHQFGNGDLGQDFVIAMGELQRRGVDPNQIRQAAIQDSPASPEWHQHQTETMLRAVEGRGIN